MTLTEKRRLLFKKFKVGYPVCPDNAFVESVRRNIDQISGIYFGLPTIANGRPEADRGRMGASVADKVTKILKDLKQFPDLEMDFLVNALCYGENSLTRAFFERLKNTIDMLKAEINLSSVTVTSYLIAGFIKKYFPELKVKASVNLNLKTEREYDYLSSVCDGFHLARSNNRNLDAIKKLRKYCDDHQKELYMLVNSGCVNDCAGHITHDNIMAHSSRNNHDKKFELYLLCKQYLSDPAKRKDFFKFTNMIRPEDTWEYVQYIDSFKLATRVNSRFPDIINAYCNCHYDGNLLELTEPQYTSMFGVENTKFPDDFNKKTSTCKKKCSKCNYCIDVFNAVMIEHKFSTANIENQNF